MNIDTVTKLIEAIAKILWPIITFILLLLFKKDISTLLNRIKKGTFFGNEVELNSDIDNLRKSVRKTEDELPAENNKIDDYSQKIIETSSNNPKTGLIELAIEIEKTLKNLMYSSGWFNNVRNISVHSSFDFLIQNGVLPTNTMSSLQIFWDIRNKIIHGAGDVSDSEIIKVIDIGLTLLKIIKSIPQTIHKVYKTNIDIYHDKDCKIKNEQCHGIILEEISPGQSIKEYRIYPTTKKDYKEGALLSWEWNMNNKWRESYYIDPDTKEKKMAWGAAAEFVGRELDKI